MRLFRHTDYVSKISTIVCLPTFIKYCVVYYLIYSWWLTRLINVTKSQYNNTTKELWEVSEELLSRQFSFSNLIYQFLKVNRHIDAFKAKEARSVSDSWFFWNIWHTFDHCLKTAWAIKLKFREGNHSNVSLHLVLVGMHWLHNIT